MMLLLLSCLQGGPDWRDVLEDDGGQCDVEATHWCRCVRELESSNFVRVCQFYIEPNGHEVLMTCEDVLIGGVEEDGDEVIYIGNDLYMRTVEGCPYFDMYDFQE